MYITILVKQVYLYISQVSGERLQDHWSSGILKFDNRMTLINMRKILPIHVIKLDNKLQDLK